MGSRKHDLAIIQELVSSDSVETVRVGTYTLDSFDEPVCIRRPPALRHTSALESAFVPQVVDSDPTTLLVIRNPEALLASEPVDPAEQPPFPRMRAVSGLMPDRRRYLKETLGFMVVLFAMSIASVALGVALARFGVF
jgi:hypothetical protein